MTASFFEVSRTPLSILADINNAVVRMVSICPLISKSSSLFINPLGIVPSALITTSITVTFMFHSFFFLFSSLFTFFQFSSMSVRTAKFTIRQVLFFFFFFFVCVLFLFLFLLAITRSGHLTKITRSVCISKFERSLCVSFSGTNSELCIYRLFVRSNLSFLHNYQWIIYSTHIIIIIIIIIIIRAFHISVNRWFFTGV